MQINEIIDAVGKFKPVKRRQVCRYLVAFKIAPLGIRQRPQQYPANSAQLILAYLGLLPPIIDLPKEKRYSPITFEKKNGRIVATKTLTRSARKTRRKS